MSDPKKQSAPLGGAKFTKLAGGVNGQRKILKCSTHHIAKFRREIRDQGLGLRNSSGQTQKTALLAILQYLGDRGANTKELEGIGFFRAATRVQEIEADGWYIESRRENLIGPEGLYHVGNARYVLIGRCADFVNPQGSLDLGGA